MHWSTQQVKEFSKQIAAEWRGGWPFFTDDVRRAIVDAKALAIICSQDRATVDVEAVCELKAALREAMAVSL